IVYTRGSNGEISAVQVTQAGNSAAPPTVVSGITHWPFGPINAYTLGNGQTVTRSYDANYRLTDLVSPTLNLHYARDPMGDIQSEGSGNPLPESYQYDALYRLTTTTTHGSLLETDACDKTGDRLSKSAAGLATGTYAYTPGTHQLASIAGVAFANDANGNTTGSVIGTIPYGFGYNGRTRLTTAQANQQTVATYTYNAWGQRIGKVTGGSTERYAYDQANHLIGEYGNATNRDYIWVDDLPVAVIDNTINGSVTTSTANYIIADGLNTPRRVMNAAGTTIWSWPVLGNPFGEQPPTSSTGYVLNLRYPGQYYDAETNTNYNLFRTYEPATGRYLQSDPIGLAGGISTYAYVSGDPIDYVDPNGLWQITIEGGYFFGGQITFGNNGGSGLFNGQWNVGVRGGFGEGLALSVDPKNSGCHAKGFSDTGVKLDGTVKLGSVGVAISGEVTADGSTMDVGLDTGAAHLTIPLFSNGLPSMDHTPVIGFGEAATLSGGSSYYF